MTNPAPAERLAPPRSWDVRHLLRGGQTDPLLAKAILAVVLIGFFLVGLVDLLYSEPRPWSIALCIVGMSVMFAVQIAYFTRPLPEVRTWRGRVVLGLQGLLAMIPLLVLGTAWAGVPGFFAGSLLIGLRSRVGIPAFVATAALTGLAQRLSGGTPTDVVFTGVSTLITGVVVYGLTRLTMAFRELAEARAEIVRLAVAQERFRFASDLHDVLGYSLSAITLKAELANRLALQQQKPGEADEALPIEIEEILELSRSALTDVRAVASGYRSMSWRGELASVRAVLESAEIAVTADQELEVLPPHVDTTFASVLREAATNALRHSKAERFDICLLRDGETVVMTLSNDGATARTGRSATSSGLISLEQRMIRIGGRLRWDMKEGWFQVDAIAPIAGPELPDPSI